MSKAFHILALWFLEGLVYIAHMRHELDAAPCYLLKCGWIMSALDLLISFLQAVLLFYVFYIY